MKNKTKILIIYLGIILLIIGVGFYTDANTKYDGEFPEGCFEDYPINTTFKGQVIRATENSCYSKLYEKDEALLKTTKWRRD